MLLLAFLAWQQAADNVVDDDDDEEDALFCSINCPVGAGNVSVGGWGRSVSDPVDVEFAIDDDLGRHLGKSFSINSTLSPIKPSSS